MTHPGKVRHILIPNQKENPSDIQEPERELGSKDKDMIHFFIDDDNIKPAELQTKYEKCLEEMELHRIVCPCCGKAGCLIRYGCYSRTIRYLCERVILTVQRLFCNHCRKTHALLPDLIVPYSQVPLEDQRDAILCPEEVLERNDLIDEGEIYRLRKNYRKVWKQRLLSAGIRLDAKLTLNCFRYFRMQFMQIRRGCCGLFASPT